MDASVLLTGANGFIGRRLLERFASLPWLRVVAVVRSATGQTYSENVRQLVIADPITYQHWPSVLSEIDTIIHVAGIISPPIEAESEQDRRGVMMRVNRDLTEVLAKNAVAAKVKQFIYLSSMSVYGSCRQPAMLTPESPVAIDGIYPESKYAGERVIEEVFAETAVNWVHIRPPMVVGEGTKGTFYSMANLCIRLGFSPFGMIRDPYPIVRLATLCDFVVAAVKLNPIDSGVYLVGEPDTYTLPRIIDEIALISERKIRHLPIPVPVVRALMTMAGKRPAFDHVTSNLTLDTSKSDAVLDQFRSFPVTDSK